MTLITLHKSKGLSISIFEYYPNTSIYFNTSLLFCHRPSRNSTDKIIINYWIFNTHSNDLKTHTSAINKLQ